VYNLFWNSKEANTLGRKWADRYHSDISLTDKAGLTPVGVTTTWVLPASAKPALVPETDSAHGTRVRRLSCVADTGDDGYQPMTAWRNEMYRTLVREFSQLDYLVIGYELNLEFYDCEGKRLGIKELILFSADTLEGCTAVVKNVELVQSLISIKIPRRG
jgi:hypothetical protein